jgi:hypothetical protein
MNTWVKFSGCCGCVFDTVDEYQPVLAGMGNAFLPRTYGLVVSPYNILHENAGTGLIAETGLCGREFILLALQLAHISAGINHCPMQDAC